MTPISVPPQHVTYTVKQSGWISPSQWHSFTLVVTEAFWLLPVHLRPCSPTDGTRLERASMMFTHPGAFEFGGKDEGNYISKSVMFTLDMSPDLRIETEGQPIDFFTRIALLMLYHHCSGCFEITSSAGGVSWALPVRWAIRHQLIADSNAPQPFSTHGFITGAADELLIRSVSGAERPFTTADWGLVSELEFALEELKTDKR
ncbi:hypothetical protein GJV14_13820 [Enterobacteriaceae bacterium RIT697]|uniref:hypothetical protein n=1 Tax=Pantoea endophytica TaxID=92488 RepID=UPI0012AE4572|nr:hypothetical protein [Pantoea endophytica]MRT25019.1 hypothetical protein [Enterobacteriaceae bacterium RIT697]